MEKLADLGMNKIIDLIDVSGQFYTYEQLMEHYPSLNIPWLQYYSIISAIPMVRVY